MYRSGSVVALGVRNHVAPSNSSAVARSGPRASEPQIGCPPMKRASPAAAATTAPFVEPTSVTVQPLGAASSTARTWAGSAATGAATTASPAPARAVTRSAAGSTAPRSAAAARCASSGSQPATSHADAAATTARR